MVGHRFWLNRVISSRSDGLLLVHARLPRLSHMWNDLRVLTHVIHPDLFLFSPFMLVSVVVPEQNCLLFCSEQFVQDDRLVKHEVLHDPRSRAPP